MGGCCGPAAYGRFFSERQARRDANRFRRKGLDATALRIVDFLRGRGLANSTVLEAGGGVGALQIELLRAGVARVVGIELSPSYEAAAGELLRKAGLEERVERRLGDFVSEADSLEPAEAVVMNKVVCCYPAPADLVGAAAELARRYLVMTFPRDRLLTRLGVRAVNVVLRLARQEFRAYVHPPATILASAERHGLRPAHEHRGAIWQLAALERAA